MFQPSDNFCGPPLEWLQQVLVFSVLRAPDLDDLDAVFQMGSHESRVGSRISSFDLLANLIGMNLNLLSYSLVLFYACMLKGPIKLRKMTPSVLGDEMQYFPWISFGTPPSSWCLTAIESTT